MLTSILFGLDAFVFVSDDQCELIIEGVFGVALSRGRYAETHFSDNGMGRRFVQLHLQESAARDDRESFFLSSFTIRYSRSYQRRRSAGLPIRYRVQPDQ